MTLLSENTVKARKQHVCEGCNTEIDSGSQYVRCAGVGDGRAFTLHYHPECRAQEIEVNRLAGTCDDEWMTLADDIEGGGIEMLEHYQPVVAERLRGWLRRSEEALEARCATLVAELTT